MFEEVNLKSFCACILGVLAILEPIGFGQAADRASKEMPIEGHVAWVVKELKRMEAVKVGMTREDLLAVFTTEGGLSTGLQRTFVSRECEYFKVDVEFRAVGRPDRDQEGRVTVIEDGRDIIVKISRPYLQFSILH